ncbi:permease prefix domain 1-containing protein [Microbacterium sp. zg.B48]|uniref:permease prefix domain 1-containing protein n=1 Tax=Microbacterium sp. zg.B48 TaxID=2969408 RepID=UPI00214AAB4F|nr:permease prefix domain 1-containing protein [Microbacterium sp. zg.B48]MCR2765037.1 permease prefix domain 1-containing protein [Microbacterium sp. zg.B48]
MSVDSESRLEAQIASWTQYVRRRRAVAGADVDELEGHLRDQVDDLVRAGLSEEESFLVAIRRIGSLDDVSREYAREHSDRLWKQLVIEDPAGPERRRRPILLVVALAVGAGLAVKLPSLFGVTIGADPEFYLRNAGILVLPFLAAFFLWTRRAATAVTIVVAAAFAMTAVILNVYPFVPDGMTVFLASGHALIVLWLAVGLAYTGGVWRSDTLRMDFIRFTGEWVVYYTLIALGGAVLIALTLGVFGAIGVDAGGVIQDWILPCGAAGAVIVAAGLVEAKQSVIENIAPVLTKLFTPLFTLMLLALVVAAVMQRDLLETSRDLLILFDVVLIVVLGLLLYSLSARDPEARPGWFERLQLVMVSSAIVVDLLVLTAMVARIGAFGFSANKVASLGLNVLLLVNLAWSAYLLTGILRGTVRPARLERWQTRYLPVYLGWALIVVIVFPPVFAFA